MKVLIDSLNEFYSEKIRLVKALMKRESPQEYPEPMKWALQMLYFDGEEWGEICRIDNYLHERQNGRHIHFYKNIRLIKQISARILKDEFMEQIDFGDG